MELEFYLNFLIGCAITACRNPAVIKFQFPRVSSGNHPLANLSLRTLGTRLVLKLISYVFLFTLLSSVIG